MCVGACACRVYVRGFACVPECVWCVSLCLCVVRVRVRTLFCLFTALGSVLPLFPNLWVHKKECLSKQFHSITNRTKSLSQLRSEKLGMSFAGFFCTRTRTTVSQKMAEPYAHAVWDLLVGLRKSLIIIHGEKINLNKQKKLTWLAYLRPRNKSRPLVCFALIAILPRFFLSRIR